ADVGQSQLLSTLAELRRNVGNEGPALGTAKVLVRIDEQGRDRAHYPWRKVLLQDARAGNAGNFAGKLADQIVGQVVVKQTGDDKEGGHAGGCNQQDGSGSTRQDQSNPMPDMLQSNRARQFSMPSRRVQRMRPKGPSARQAQQRRTEGKRGAQN